MFIDTHAHLTFPELAADTEGILEACRQHQVSHVISIACSPESHEEDLARLDTLAKISTSPRLHGAAGIHPDHFDDPEERDIEVKIRTLATKLNSLFDRYQHLLVAVGECGLDYYRTFHREAQQQLLRMQLTFAAERDLPVIVHVRDAWDDLFCLLENYPDLPFVIHCFTGGKAEAERILTWPKSMISLSGIVSFKNATDIQAAVPHIPLNRMLVETDSPFLAPVPHRGKTNQPAFVSHVAEAIAAIMHVTPEEIGARTSANAQAFFRLPEVSL